MPQLTFGEAVRQALVEEMQRDPAVFLAGEGIGVSIHDNPKAPTYGLLEMFGPERVKDTPVSEAAIAGLAVGAAAMGLRPVVEIMFSPFLTIASDQIVNHAAKLRYLSGGKSSFPLVVRVKAGSGAGPGCQHFDNLEAWMAHSPGLKVVFPSTPRDAKGLLKAAIRDNDPVIFFEDMNLSFAPGPVPEDSEFLMSIGKAEVKRSGRDVTIAAWGRPLVEALKAAEQLAQEEGIQAEVLDLLSLAPLDKETLLRSVRKTGRLVVAHDANKTGGFGAEVAAVAAEEAFRALRAPIRRVAAPDVPVAFSPPMAFYGLPDAARMMATVREMMVA